MSQATQCPRPFGNRWYARALATAFMGVVRVRNALYDAVPALSTRCRMPVISVGGLHAGGSGKTPLVALIAERLLSDGVEVCIASRGYGRSDTRLRVVEPNEACDWREVGDEPAMLHRRLPATWLAVFSRRERAIAAAAARMPHGKPRVALLDDGFQHRRVRRDLDIVCLPAGFWHSFPLPAGYRREPYSALRRADAICLIGDETQREQLLDDARRVRRTLLNDNVFVLLQRTGPIVDFRSGKQFHALPFSRPSILCGIARPERFLHALASLGADTSDAKLFGDHHAFTPADIDRALIRDTDGLLTTEKDAVRISSLKLANQHTICYLSLRLAFFESSADIKFNDLLHSRTLQVRGPR